eukprot:TRINITY_DN17774_c0_g1_i5.p2 TRINITY_DN17774_c0_g1~~TRINITY_DN17774_c0_g1_i5.p2  ORF type:complete len:157 (+),score=15.82 TRINITY_DN17774_c0_g1_i5:82-552(+)
MIPIYPQKIPNHVPTPNPTATQAGVWNPNRTLIHATNTAYNSTNKIIKQQLLNFESKTKLEITAEKQAVTLACEEGIPGSVLREVLGLDQLIIYFRILFINTAIKLPSKTQQTQTLKLKRKNQTAIIVTMYLRLLFIFFRTPSKLFIPLQFCEVGL